jgi:hypothetical protein
VFGDVKYVRLLFLTLNFQQMGEWVLFQLPADFQLSELDGKKLSLSQQGLQNAGNFKMLATQVPSDHILPLREKKGKIKVAGSLTRSVQVVKTK